MEIIVSSISIIGLSAPHASWESAEATATVVQASPGAALSARRECCAKTEPSCSYCTHNIYDTGKQYVYDYIPVYASSVGVVSQAEYSSIFQRLSELSSEAGIVTSQPRVTTTTLRGALPRHLSAGPLGCIK